MGNYLNDWIKNRYDDNAKKYLKVFAKCRLKFMLFMYILKVIIFIFGNLIKYLKFHTFWLFYGNLYTDENCKK